MRGRTRPVICLVALVCLFGGCSSEVKSRLGKRSVVKGKLTVGGKAITGGTVVFTPVDAAGGDEQVGPIAENGTYITSVFPGKFKVSITGNQYVPAKYRSPQTTDLETAIGDTDKNDVNFDMN